MVRTAAEPPAGTTAAIGGPFTVDTGSTAVDETVAGADNCDALSLVDEFASAAIADAASNVDAPVRFACERVVNVLSRTAFRATERLSTGLSAACLSTALLCGRLGLPFSNADVAGVVAVRALVTAGMGAAATATVAGWIASTAGHTSTPPFNTPTLRPPWFSSHAAAGARSPPLLASLVPTGRPLDAATAGAPPGAAIGATAREVARSSST